MCFHRKTVHFFANCLNSVIQEFCAQIPCLTNTLVQIHLTFLFATSDEADWSSIIIGIRLTICILNIDLIKMGKARIIKAKTGALGAVYMCGIGSA